ncbi:MAG: helix-turn-helix transcriptional regulator [Sphaerochaetaceae bacterium]
MNGVALFIYMVAFAIGCMTLALAIVYQIQKPHPWTKYFIVCISSLLGCMMLSAVQLLTSILLSGPAYQVASFVVGCVFVANVAFLVSFIPYFTTWVIGVPWRNPYKFFFISLSAGYLSFGMFALFKPTPWFSSLLEIMFVFVLAFCFIVLLKNIDSIEQKGVRTVCITEMIVSVSMLPAIGLSIIFPSLRVLMYGIYFLAFSITVMTFLFMYFRRNKESGPKVLSLEDLAPYHITERELMIIRLVSQGLTNKEIAAQLDISANTVNNHVANIFAKTKVRSRIDLLNLLKQPW